MADTFNARSTLSVGGNEYEIFRLSALSPAFDLTHLPYSLKILLENLLRHEDGVDISRADIEALAGWDAKAEPATEIAFTPARVLLQDFTGVPAVVDLAAMRDAMRTLGDDPEKISPMSPAPEDGFPIGFEMDDALKQKVEAFKESSIMLVVPEEDFFVKTLSYYFESAGWEVEVFTEVVDALAKIESGKAYLTVLDASMADWQKFCYALKVRRETANVPLIVMYPNEDAFKLVQDVIIVGDENISQPFEFREIMDVADGEIMRAAEEELVFHQQVNLHIPTDEPSIEKVIDWVHKALERSGINEEGQVAMSAAFREAVVNAAQHGSKYKRDRKIQIQYLLDEKKITAIVRDQGNGFDHSQYVKSGSTRDALSAARDRHQQGRMGGLGIMLMLRCCNRLEYNKAGNQISLTKLIKAEE